MSKLLKVYSTTTNSLKEFTVSDNITWKEVVDKIGGNISNLIGRGRQSKVTYELPDAQINAQDEIIFVGPKKMDSGIRITTDTLEALYVLKEDLKVELNSMIDKLFLDVKEEVKQEVEDQLENKESGCEECDELSDEASDLGFN